MKKKLTIALLLFSMVLSVLAGCATDTPSAGSSDPAAESSSSEGTAEGGEWQAYVDRINSLYTEDIQRSGMERYLISTGKTVTASRTFEGDAALMSDGEFITENTASPEAAAVHFSGREDTEILLDLGEVVKGVGDFAISLLSSTKLGASLPRELSYYVSADGNDYVLIGTAYRTREVLADQGNLYDLRLQMGVDVRYIKAVIPQSAFISDDLYVDEFCVFKYREAEKEDESVLSDAYYQNEPLPEVTENLFWDAAESDFNDRINLVSSLPYRIYSVMEIEPTYATEYYNSPVSNPVLTDGKKASLSYSDSGYFHFTRCVGRKIVFDLGKVSAVSEISIGSFYGTAGIVVPGYISVLGSMDGKEWGVIAEYKPNIGATVGRRTDISFTFDATKARFISVDIGTDGHIWLDEISVFGKKNTEGAADLTFDNNSAQFADEYISPDALGGSENLMLMYTFKNESRDTGLNTKEELLPYVAYIDQSGTIKDTFFDSFLFLPCMTVCPSGGHLYYDSTNPSRMTDWIAFEDDLFYEDCNVNGLELAVDEMDSALGTDSTIPIYFSIFSTVYGDKGFGDVDGDGVNEDFSKIEDRKKVIKWWIDRLIARYENGAYENTKLDGFYWYHEAMEPSDPHELELVRYTADYLHSMGYYFIWIPYFTATGYADWKSYGFDAAVMQPNYMFSDDVPEERLYYNAEYTKALGMGVEIEADYGVISDKAKLAKYLAYLRVGVETGYMHSIKMYYQDGGPGVFYGAYKATDPAFRSVYDLTYKYAKGTLRFGLYELVSTTFTGKKDQAVGIVLEASDGSALTPEIYLSAKYGSVKAAGNGKFLYYPPEGFTGTDTFVVKDQHSDDDPGTVITVVIE